MDVFEAIETNNLELFCELVNEGNVNTIYLNDQSLLRFAMRQKRIDFIRHLIHIGADVNYTCDAWWPALMRAVDDGDLKITKILLNAGSNVTCINSEGFTPLGLFLRNGRLYRDCVKLLIDRGAHKHLSNQDVRLEDWMIDCIATRTKNNQSTILILTLHKQRQGPLWFIKQDKHVIKMIGKHVWSMRMLEQTTP
jgi:hypothetical protein